MKTLFYIIGTLLIFSCGNTPKSKYKLQEKTTISFEKQWETDGFSMPESVYASANHDWLYVSNVNGQNSGFISRVSKNGEIDNLQWATGLNSPTGMDMYNEKLYVADGTVLRVINTATGEIENSLTGDGVVNLNDVSIADNGTIYISDIAGGKIYTVENNELVVGFQFDEIPFPNGVFVQGDELLIANYGTVLQPQLTQEQYGSLYSVSLTDENPTAVNIGNQLGGLDGITEVNNTVFITGNPAGELIYLSDGTATILGTYDAGIADIGSAENVIYAPFLQGNKVVAYTIE